MENPIKVELSRLFGIVKNINSRIRKGEQANDVYACRIIETPEKCRTGFEQEKAEALILRMKEQQIV